jgi:uncharacterized SAM-binding protein YcdF (DUF218 family)
MLSILKWIGVPGSIPFLGVCSAIGLVCIYLWPRSRRVGRLWLISVFVLYLCLGVPLICNTIISRLPTAPPPANVTSGTVDTVFVLAGDNRRGRVAETLRLYESAAPRRVFLSTGRWELERLLDAGVPRERIHIDGSARNTREQIEQLKALRHASPPGRIVVVASRLQMPRVSALIDAARLDVTLAPSRIDDEPPVSGGWSFVPSYIALRASRDALYEHAAIAFYAYRGWISSTSGAFQSAAR